MKKRLLKDIITLSLLMVFLCGFNPFAKAQLVTIPDANFRAWLETNYPSCMVGTQGNKQLNITCSNVLSATSLVIQYRNIVNLEGMQYFTSLTGLNCSYNKIEQIPNLPPLLTHIDIRSNKLQSLPSLPSSLQTLYCMDNQLQTLPPLPSSLRNLSCYNNQLQTLPPLPSLLQDLSCYNNKLQTLPSLPNSLRTLYCGDNTISNLSSIILPNTLWVFSCYNNQLSSLPILPNSLSHLDCGRNPLAVLPNLPNSLQSLYCNDNILTTLPTLPNILTYVECSNNLITSLPINLPPALEFLFCNNNELTSLPNLPSTLYWLELNNNKLESLPSLPSNLFTLYCNNNKLESLPTIPQRIINNRRLKASNNKLQFNDIVPIINAFRNATDYIPQSKVFAPTPKTFYVGSPIILDSPFEVTNDGGYYYYWYKDGVSISGGYSFDPPYTKSSATITDKGVYRCEVVYLSTFSKIISTDIVVDVINPPSACPACPDNTCSFCATLPPTPTISVNLPPNQIQERTVKVISESARRIIDGLNELLQLPVGSLSCWDRHHVKVKFIPSNESNYPTLDKVPTGIGYDATGNSNYVRLLWAQDPLNYTYFWNPTPWGYLFPLCQPCSGGLNYNYLPSGLVDNYNHVYFFQYPTGINLTQVASIDYANAFVNNINSVDGIADDLILKFNMKDGTIRNASFNTTLLEDGYYKYLPWKKNGKVKKILLAPNQSITLSAPQGYVSYRWSDGRTDRQITVSQAGFYSVTVTNGCTVTSTDIIEVVNSTCQPTLTTIPSSWHFGKGGSLQFSANSVIATTTASGLNTLEGSASISDASGSLLFYTDGSKIYNKNNAMMAGGDLGANNNSTTQSSIIVPKPGSSTSYYVFYNNYSTGGIRGIYYVEVDMSANGGLGAVLGTSPGFICGGTSSEKLTAIQVSDGIWVVATQGGAVCASKITSAGVNTSSYYSSSMQSILGNTLNINNSDIGYLKASPDGTKLAFCLPGEGSVVLANFDKATGEVSNPVKLADKTLSKVYGAEFSPDGTKLYVSKYGNSAQIYQIDLSNNSLNLLSNVESEIVGALQLGPDGNIYVARLNSRYLGRITNSNSSPVYVDDAIDLGEGRFSRLGLPNFVVGCSN